MGEEVYNVCKRKNGFSFGCGKGYADSNPFLHDFFTQIEFSLCSLTLMNYVFIYLNYPSVEINNTKCEMLLQEAVLIIKMIMSFWNSLYF